MLCGYVLKKYGRSQAESRRPTRKAVSSGVHFNLSHSRTYVAMAVSEIDVDIDVQQKFAISDTAAKFFFNGKAYRLTRAVKKSLCTKNNALK